MQTPDGVSDDEGARKIEDHLRAHGFEDGKNGKLRQISSGAIANAYSGGHYAVSAPKGAVPIQGLSTLADPRTTVVLLITKFAIG